MVESLIARGANIHAQDMPTRGETSDAVYCRHVVIGVVRLCLGKPLLADDVDFGVREYQIVTSSPAAAPWC